MRFKFIAVLAVATMGCAELLFAAPNFTRENGVRLSSATPYSVDTTTSPYRLYFGRDGYDVRSATSSDGVAWSEEAGVRVGTETAPMLNAGTFTITGASVLKLTAGGYRMLYSVNTSTSGWQIVSATSSNGLGWANQPTVLFLSTAGFIGGPQMVKFNDGTWRLYFLRDTSGDDIVDRMVYTALSTDEGVTWSAPGVAFAQYAAALSAIVRTDRLVRLYLTRPLVLETTSTVVLSALSSSAQGSDFGLESGVRFSTLTTSGGLSSTVVFRSTENFRWRLLFGFMPVASSTTSVYSALTLSPDVQAISPSQVVRSSPASAFTISGEVFDSTPTARLTRSGEADIPGTGLVRNNDGSLGVTFDINNKALGSWNVVVTNADAQTGALSNGLTITFAGGRVELTDNLLRPRTGARTKIDVTIFDAGTVEVNVYTLDGKLVNSLYKADTPTGVLTLFGTEKPAKATTSRAAFTF